MCNYKVCYIILHYKTWKDTIECIGSLKKCLCELDRIIIVDNSPEDGSIQNVLDYYGKDSHLVYLQAYRNEGFARGNNIGFQYAKFNECADIICMFNSDTIIESMNFRSLLIESLHKNDWAVLGIDIETLKGIHQNPLKYYPHNFGIIKDLYHHIGRYIKLAVCAKKSNRKGNFSINLDYSSSFTFNESTRNWALHGAALIFSRKYIDTFNGLYPGTFMYCEEYLLKYICERLRLKMYYDPSMKIVHKEGRSTAMDYSKMRKKELFYHKNCIQSYVKLASLRFLSNYRIQHRINDAKRAKCYYKVL